VEVRLVLRAGRPCLDPPAEELRASHHRAHAGAFLGLPARMKGVSALSERAGFFAWVADADPAGVAKARRGARDCADASWVARRGARAPLAPPAAAIQHAACFPVASASPRSCSNPRTRHRPPARQVYEESEALLSRLADEARRLSDWAALAWAEATAGGADALERLAEERCPEVADFEANLRGLKVRRRGAQKQTGWELCFGVGIARVCESGRIEAVDSWPPAHAPLPTRQRRKAALRELERLPPEVRLDGYRLVTAPFRAGVEESARRLRAALAAVLRRRVRAVEGGAGGVAGTE
jgi:hypothetical protein